MFRKLKRTMRHAGPHQFSARTSARRGTGGVVALCVAAFGLFVIAPGRSVPQKPRGDVFSGNGRGQPKPTPRGTPSPRTPRGEAEYCGCPTAENQEHMRQGEKQRYDPILFKLDSWDANEEVHYQAQLRNIFRTTGREYQMALKDINLDHQRELARINKLRQEEDLCHKCRLDWISQCCHGRVAIFCYKSTCFGRQEDKNGGNSNERIETAERESRTPRGENSNERIETVERDSRTPQSGISKDKFKYIFDDPKIQAKYDQEVVRYEEEKARIIRAEKDNNYLHRSNLGMAKKRSEMERIEGARFKRTSTQISSDRVANETLHKKVMDSLPKHYEPY